MAKYSVKVIAGEFMKENTQFNAFVSNNEMNLKTFNPANSIDKNIDPECWRKYINKVDLIEETRSKDTFKIAGRTIVGSALLGVPGAIIGAASTKDDVKLNILVTYADGKRDLIECTEHIYKLLIQEQIRNTLRKDDVKLENPRNKPAFLAPSTPYLSKLERERKKLMKQQSKDFDKKLRIAIYTFIFLCGIGLYLLIA